MTTNTGSFKGYLSGIGCALAFGGYVLCNKYVYQNHEVETLHYTAAFLLGASVLGLIDFFLASRSNKVFLKHVQTSSSKRRALARAIINGLIASAAIGVLVIGQKNTTATNASLIIASNPLPTSVFAWFILKIPLSKKQYYAYPIFFIGLYIAVAGFELITLKLGDLLIICAAIAIGFTNNFSRTAMNNMTPRAVNAVRIAAGIFFSALVYLLTFNLGIYSIQVWLLAFASGAMLWASTKMLYFAIFDIGPNNSLVLAQLHILFTPIIAIFLLDEKYHLHIAIGSIVMLIGVYLFTSNRKSSREVL